METMQWRDYLGNAIRYWEPRRILYNLLLAAIVVVHFVKELPFSKTVLQFNSLLLLFVLAVLANVAYCAAYVPDVFAQMSSLRDSWLRYRWVVFAVGVAFAAVLTHFWSLAMFSHAAR
jgi:glucan phosphoethanolaminetransferase (alkaline phosphatase superfamily)